MTESSDCALQNAEWKPIPGYENYKINKSSDVFSVDNNKLIKQRINEHGYFIVDLHKDGIRHHFRVHRLVLLAFTGKPPEGKNDVNHIDGNKANNSFENLEYCSRGENIIHRHRVLNYKPSNGKRNKCLSDSEISEIREMHKSGNYTLKEIRDYWNLSQGGLCCIIYKCNGYKNRGD